MLLVASPLFALYDAADFRLKCYAAFVFALCSCVCRCVKAVLPVWVFGCFDGFAGD